MNGMSTMQPSLPLAFTLLTGISHVCLYASENVMLLLVVELHIIISVAPKIYLARPKNLLCNNSIGHYIFQKRAPKTWHIFGQDF